MRGHISKRGNSYSIVIDIGNDQSTGKRKQKWISGFKKRKDAEIALVEYLDKVNKGIYYETKKMNLKEYLEYWLITYAKINVVPSTLKRYTEFSAHISEHLGNVQINEVKPMLIQDFYTMLVVKKGLSKSTVLKIHRMLKKALKDAVGWEVIYANPLDNVKAPKAEKPEMEIWDINELNKFLETMKGTAMYIPLLLAMHTGMRQGEICGLKWKDIHFQKGVMNINRAMKIEEGKYILGELKTGSSKRSITLMNTTIEELKEHKARQQGLFGKLGVTVSPNDLVCRWEDDGRPITPGYVSKKFRELVLKLKFPIIRFHDLRHSHCSHLINQGVNVKIVSERIGHSSTKTTLDMYTHSNKDMHEKAVKKMEEVFCE